VELERAGNTITWRNACKSAVLSAAEGAQLLELLDSLLAHIVRNPEHPAVTYATDGLIIGNAPAVKGSVQPVLNGVRVDLDTIAATLKEASADIDNCAAIVVNEGGNTVLVVFVSGLRTEAAIPAVIAHAKKTLPYWSLPSYVLSTPSADIDRKKLQALFESLPEKQQYAVVQADGDWSPLELKIRGILSKVSGIPEDEIQRTQTIFHLGLDSISAIRLASDLRKAHIFLGVADILREATIERMAVAAGATATAEPSVDSKAVLAKALEGLDLAACLEGISQDNVEAVYPITAGQLYMLESWESSNRTLFMPTFTFKCVRTERSDIRSAWEKLVQQEPLLRTIFRASGDKERPYVQVVLKDSPTQFTWLESSQNADATFLRFLKTREVEKKVDMTQLPPARLCVQITPTETILFLTLHHALYDGVSLPLLLSRLQSLLQQSRPRLEGPKWVDFVALTHSQDVEKQQSFWTQYLHGATSSLVSPKKESTSKQRTGVFRPRSITNAADMEAKCRKEGISLHAVFLAAFARGLSKRSGRDDVVFGVYLANRTLPLPELQNMTAPTLNIVPLRVQGVGSKPLLELAQQVQKDLVEIGRPENAVVDLLKIHKWTGVKVDAFFNFLKPAGAASTPRSGGLVLEELQVEEETAVVKRPENLQVIVRYNGAHFWHGVWRALSLPFMPLAKLLWWILGGRHRAGQAGQVTKEARVIGVGFSDTMHMGMRIADCALLQTHLDIEVAVREGAVDVGAFSNAEYLSVDELEEVVRMVCGCVEEL
jgi:aryl carrier-like protein